MNSIAIIGDGMLGRYVYEYFSKNLFNLPEQYVLNHYSRKGSCHDIRNEDVCKHIVTNNNIIINCAAFTNVDKAESQGDVVFQTNHFAVRYLAKYCKEQNKKLIHISSEFVYGDAPMTHIFSEEDTNLNSGFNPATVYGLSKKKGDQEVIDAALNDYTIYRVSWTFGPYGVSFVDKICNWLKNPEIKELNIVSDRVGMLTSTYLITDLIFKSVCGIIPNGVYNLCNSGEMITKVDVAKYIANFMKIDKPIYPQSSDFFPSPAPRQLNSQMSCKKIDEVLEKANLSGFRHTWQHDLDLYLKTKMILGELR